MNIYNIFNGWINYILGSAIILIIYFVCTLWWDIHKYKTIINRLDKIERKLKKRT